MDGVVRERKLYIGLQRGAEAVPMEGRGSVVVEFEWWPLMETKWKRDGGGRCKRGEKQTGIDWSAEMMWHIPRESKHDDSRSGVERARQEG